MVAAQQALEIWQTDKLVGAGNNVLLPKKYVTNINQATAYNSLRTSLDGNYR